MARKNSVQKCTKLNEIIHGRLLGDSDADQRAIEQGRIWNK